jgi:hypothetical protein
MNLRESVYIQEDIFSDEMNDIFEKTSNMNVFNRFFVEFINYNTMFVNFFRQIKPDILTRKMKKNFLNLVMITIPLRLTSEPLQIIVQRHEIIEKRIIRFLLECYNVKESDEFNSTGLSFAEHELFFDDNLDLLTTTKNEPKVKPSCFANIKDIDNSKFEIIRGIPIIQSGALIDALFNFQATCFADKEFLRQFRTSNDRHLFIEQIFLKLFPDDINLLHLIIMNPFSKNLFEGQRGVLKNELKHIRLMEALYEFLLRKKRML